MCQVFLEYISEQQQQEEKKDIDPYFQRALVETQEG